MPRDLPKIEPMKKKWYYFPEMLPGGKFRGYQTDMEITSGRGYFPIGQNTSFDKEDVPTARNGYELIEAAEISDATPVKSTNIFETRNGDKWEMKTYGTGVYVFLIGTSTAWTLLKGSFTSGLKFAFANIGQTDQISSWCFFCNGTENPFRWTGVYAALQSTTLNTIVTSASSLANLDFPATGNVVINGNTYAYTGLTGGTFTGVTGDPSGEAAGSLVIASPIELTGAVSGGVDPAKFKVAMAHDGRLHLRRENRKSVWDYSNLDNPDDFTTGSADGKGGSKEVEFSGPITAFAKLNKTILCLKKRVIKVLKFNQVGTRLDSPVYETLVSVDDKSTTLGAVNDSSTFSTPVGVVFVTPDKKMVLLTGITQNNEPQYLYLSKPIQSIFDLGNHDEGSGLCVNNKIYYTFKQDENSEANDTVIIGDLEAKSTDQDGNIIPIRWDTPSVGWNVAHFTAVESANGKKMEVHWHSSLNSNSYRIINEKVDSGVSFTHTLRSWNESFDMPFLKKRMDLAYLELDMLENTKLTVTILYDIDGNSGRAEYPIRGTDTIHQRQGATYNVFGASAFGSQKIGSNPQQNEMKRYVYYLDVNPNIAFFTVSLQISGEEQNNDFKLIRFGYRMCDLITEPDRILLHNTK
jgi:hypothetical protein